MVPPMLMAMVVTGGRLLRGVGGVCISDIDNKVIMHRRKVNDQIVSQPQFLYQPRFLRRKLPVALAGCKRECRRFSMDNPQLTSFNWF
jgi:hypothetical protein